MCERLLFYMLYFSFAKANFTMVVKVPSVNFCYVKNEDRELFFEKLCSNFSKNYVQMKEVKQTLS